MKYLELYKKWTSTGLIEDAEDSRGNGGLCNTLIGRECLELFEPQKYDERESYTYWGSDDGFDLYRFGPTRQNIVLFLAAMNGEL